MRYLASEKLEITRLVKGSHQCRLIYGLKQSAAVGTKVARDHSVQGIP